jgi:acyl-CoA synthetase (AMP-forming)/AMP-acid ligase II
VADLASGRTQALGAAGEVLVRGYQVMAGYFELPEETAAAIVASHRAVAAVAVAGLADPVFGEQVAAYVELAPGTPIVDGPLSVII